jgi:hypothetical protein
MHAASRQSIESCQGKRGKVISEAFEHILYVCYQLLPSFRFTSPINDALEDTQDKEI